MVRVSLLQMQTRVLTMSVMQLSVRNWRCFFVGGIGRISGIVVGVLLLQIIFTGLNFLAVDANMLYIIKGLIILIACAIDMRKYLVRK